MATIAHCAFCFETITSNLENRQPLSLSEIEQLWNQYNEDADLSEPELPHKTAAGKIQAENISPSSSSSGQKAVPSSSSAKSTTSLQSTNVPKEAPMFVTWDTISNDDSKRLRGCIGTFEPYELEEGLKTYAKIAAFEDHRFRPIDQRELSTLACSVTLLTDFEPAPEPMDWEIGKHGIRISFSHNGRRYGSTYLPDVAREQGWTKTEAMVSLMRKAGWSGRSSEWSKVDNLKVIRYQGKKTGLTYQDWSEFKDWCDAEVDE